MDKSNKRKVVSNPQSDDRSIIKERDSLFKIIPIMLFAFNQKRKDGSFFIKMLNNSCLFIGTLLLGWGLPEIMAGQEYAKWLIVVGCLLIAIRIVMDVDVRHYFIGRIGRNWYIILCVIVCLVAVLPMYFVSQNKINYEAETTKFIGIITPKAESTETSIRLVLGNGIFINVNPTGKYILSNSSKPFLSINIDQNGYLKLNAKIKDNAKNNIIEIKNNMIRVPRRESPFNPFQPDIHSLKVFDSDGNEVLNVVFSDEKTIYITGVFYIDGYSEPITITDNNGMTFPGGSFFVCSADLTNDSGSFINFDGNKVSINR